MSTTDQAGALLKMAKGIASRKSRAGCRLDTRLMREHTAWFQSTFGEPPTGRLAAYPEATELEDRTPWSPALDVTSLAALVARLPSGKATGCDNVFGEVLKIGGDLVIQPLLLLLTKICRSNTLPLDWKRALVVPIFKKKGSDQDAANYRPISLTSIARRLYERWLLRSLEPFLTLLNDYQGGFRSGRSTLHQAYALQQVISAHSGGLHIVFLDLKAAYDRVDRRILWNRLLNKYRVPPQLVTRLQALFDNNESCLVINGERGEWFANRRGLLQGSSLAPVLFNFFIDDLLDKLQAAGVPRVRSNGVTTNCLAFADDINLHASDIGKMTQLLKICQDWADDCGMEFAAGKCVYLNSANSNTSPVRIHGLTIPSRIEAEYLGIPFTRDGWNLRANIAKRTQTAAKVTNVLANIGMNGNGFSQEASGRLYKTFIRSTIEYGLQLELLGQPGITLAQRSQEYAFRRIFSAQRNTSRLAMHKLLQIPAMETRNMDLASTFYSRLHNSTDSTIPAVRIWWDSYTTTNRTSPTFKAIRNPWWEHHPHLSHFTARLSRVPAREAPLEMSKSMKKKLYKASLVAMDLGKTNVAGTIQLELTDPIRHILLPRAFQNRRTRTTVMRWITGGIAMHKPCLQCNDGTEVSRAHGAACSGANLLLQAKYYTIINPDLLQTAMDQLLNHYRTARAPPAQLYTDIAEACSLIYTKCLGYNQLENGYWEQRRAEDVEASQQPLDQDLPP